MTVNLNLDPEVLSAATAIATASGRSVGEVVSELAKKGLGAPNPDLPTVVGVELRNGVPVFVTDRPAKPIDPEVVRQELEENGF